MRHGEVTGKAYIGYCCVCGNPTEIKGDQPAAFALANREPREEIDSGSIAKETRTIFIKGVVFGRSEDKDIREHGSRQRCKENETEKQLTQFASPSIANRPSARP